MSLYTPDPRIRLYFLLNSAAIPLRSIAVDDARVHIDVLQPGGDKKWLTETSAGVVAAETVIGGGSKRVRALVI